MVYSNVLCLSKVETEIHDQCTHYGIVIMYLRHCLFVLLHLIAFVYQSLRLSYWFDRNNSILRKQLKAIELIDDQIVTTQTRFVFDVKKAVAKHL